MAAFGLGTSWAGKTVTNGHDVFTFDWHGQITAAVLPRH
jgi:hypothetical protein